jgi:outer membrane receptor protein involved in Fe transport
MSTSLSIRRAVRCALLTSATLFAASATTVFAQEGGTISEVVVTGSRIAQPNLTSISPVTTIGADDVKIEGTTRVEDLVNNLPQAFGEFGNNLANGATGTASVNLRGLGSQRTLVLVNGRRLMPGDPTQNGNATPDLNQIPAPLIERVEVLTGGASAVYGADAVAGVVNFIMNDNFEGVRLDAQYNVFQHENDSSIDRLVAARNFGRPDNSVTDGDDMNLTFLLGANSEDGKGNITVYAGYRSTNALLQSQRDFSACSLNATNDGLGRVCGGSGTTSPPQLQAIVQTGALAGANALPMNMTLAVNADGTLRPFTGADQFNFAPFNYYQRPDDRYTAGLFAKYAVSDSMEVYTEFSFMNDETVAQIAPSGLFFGGGPGAGGGYLVNCDNPFLSAAQVSTFCTQRGLGPTDVASIGIGKRNVEGGGRQSALEHTSYRAVIGTRGDISDSWSFDAYGLYGTTEYAQTFFNDFSGRRATNALIATRDGMGNIVCGINVDNISTNDDAACVPYNPFTPGGVTQDALNYLQVPGFQNGSTVEVVLSASLTGDLSNFVKLPSATGGLAVAFGAEYRSEDSTLRNDSAFATGDLLGQGGATLDTLGSYDVKEVFAEARLPILEDKPFARSVTVEAGYRYSDYNLGFDTDTYKFGADWSPVEDVRLRASFQRAVRAPNIQELFRPQVVQLDGSTDPCAGPNPMFTPAQCALTGVSAAQFGNILANPANQYNGLTGGNPDLDPEISDTVSFGFVYTPGFLPNFSVALDFFDIEVEDTIDGIGADLIINTCLANGDPTFCNLINRAPGSGSLFLGMQGSITNTTQNTGSLTTQGVDIDANYVWKTGNVGDLRFSLVGTFLDELETEPLPGFTKFDCSGLYGNVCATPKPEFRSKLRSTWSTPWNLDVSLTWRYLDAVENEGTVANTNFAQDFSPIDTRLGSRSYFDLSAAYGFKTEVADVKVRLGIDNLTDKDPPIVTSENCTPVFCSGNTFPQVYETLGRTFMFNVTTDF